MEGMPRGDAFLLLLSRPSAISDKKDGADQDVKRRPAMGSARARVIHPTTFFDDHQLAVWRSF